MITDKAGIKRELRQRVLFGYHPSHTVESSEDFGAAFFLLTDEEFDEVYNAAIKESATVFEPKTKPAA